MTPAGEKKRVINVSVLCELVYILVLSQVKVSTNFIKSIPYYVRFQV